MDCKQREKEFVARHVDIFIKRHWKKINEVSQRKTLETIIKESGNTDIIKAAANVEAIEEEIKVLQHKLKEAIEGFKQAYGTVYNNLICDAETARSKFLQEKQEKFEYNIRRAIGLVELVSSERAYEVLEDCRADIENRQ